ncbi:hypothetical protein [Halothiobacillus sp. DCM-1]|uniref:hypothetical protein n=1 Tax=Halothiobacillus sp. DCM-1 TaxID=3112558 RepID=UPI0032468900
MSVDSLDSAVFDPAEESAPAGSVDRLAQKIDTLTQAALALLEREQACRETAERLAEDNARLRQILQHTQLQITQLSQQIRGLEDMGS